MGGIFHFSLNINPIERCQCHNSYWKGWVVVPIWIDRHRWFAKSHYNNDVCFHFTHHGCRNPTLAKCGGEAQHLEKSEVGSLPGLPNVQSSTARGKTPRIGVLLVSLERSWNVDIENGLALAIRTSAAQVMGKRRAGSQTGSR
jgi:hypothetical protein